MAANNDVVGFFMILGALVGAIMSGTVGAIIGGIIGYLIGQAEK